MKRKYSFFYGWVVLAVAFVAMTFAMGARNSFSAFYVVILDEFGWTRANTAGIFSVNVITYGIAAPFAGALVDRFGPKKILLIGTAILALAIMLCSIANTIYHFYFLFGVGGAIGSSLVGYPVNASILPHWFVRRRGMAFGIFTSGWGASFLLIPAVQFLIGTFGWRTSFILFGTFIGAVLFPLVALFSQHKPQDMGLLPDGDNYLGERETTSNKAQRKMRVNEAWVKTNWTLKKAIETYQFWLIFFSFFLIFGFAENIVVVHQIALLKDVGFSSAFAALIVAFWGIMVIVGNFGSFISDKIGREKTFTLGCLISILGLFMLLLLETASHNLIAYLYAIFFGLGIGMNSPVLGAALADIFHSKNFGSINGFVVLGFGLGGIVGPWFGGFIFDTTRSYSLALIAAILATFLSFILLWIAAPRKIRKIG